MRVRDASCTSGMCPICIRNCPVLCEISMSAFRGREALYPEPAQFGHSTAGGLKYFGIDWSDFNIHASLLGAEGIEPDPDRALFPNVNIESKVGPIALSMPLTIGAFGSTDVGRNYWEGLAIGAAVNGVICVVGENVCGMDMEARLQGGKVTYSKEMERRVNLFRKFWDGKHGDMAVQTNVEDQRLGVDVYVMSKLEVNIIERKWGQGAKAIGGEVRIKDLEKALELKRRGYLVIPDPQDKAVQEAFKENVFETFERHSRVGMPEHKSFVEDVEWLRKQGAKVVSLKTGAYRPSAVAFTMKAASEAKIDYVTFDGAGGGTGMSPVPMMDEMSMPTVNLEVQVLRCAELLKKKGKHVPDLIIAGGFIKESQMLKAIAMSNYGKGPYVKAINMGRSPLTAAFKGSYYAELAEKGQLPKAFAEKYGATPDKFLISAFDLKKRFGDRAKEIPWQAVALCGYFERLRVGLQQLMAGCRKWKLDLINRNDIFALTERGSRVTGIPLAEDTEKDAIERILGS